MSKDRAHLSSEEPMQPVPPPGQEPSPTKPAELKNITGSSWRYAFKRAFKEFTNDQCTDVAAGLTYYSVMSIFPGLLALIALLGIFGQDPKTVDDMLQSVKSISPDAVSTLEGPLKQLTESQATGFALVIGLLSALWSASGYVGAFGRALNRIYDIREGRPFLKLRPVQLLVTLITVTLAAVAGLMLVVSGPIAKTLGDVIGLGDQVATVWDWAKLPVVLLIVVLVVALLYYATPNVKMPKFRWLSPGAGFAVLVWVLASIAFGFYVSHFGSYNKTYGALAGIIVFLLWLWLTNLALLFGAELDVEVLRARQLQAGMKADRDVILEVRDDQGIEKQKKSEDQLRLEAMDLRREAKKKEAEEQAESGASSEAAAVQPADGHEGTGAHTA